MFRWRLDMKIQGPVQALSGNDYWTWKIHIVGGSDAQFGAEWTIKECLEKLNYYASLWTGRNLIAQCECGSKNLYAAFAPGHAHWCPVSPQNIVPAPPKP